MAEVAAMSAPPPPHMDSPASDDQKDDDPITSRGVPSSQTPGHASFRRQRASRACETCHARKVRCDAASLGVPCTNCVAFSIECKIPPPKRKKSQGKGKDSESEHTESKDNNNNTTTKVQSPQHTQSPTSVPPREQVSTYYSERPTLGIKPSEDATTPAQDRANGQYAQLMKPKFVRAPIKEAGRVAYLGESSNLSLLVHDRYGTTDVVHYPLPEHVRGTRARLSELDNVEIDILHQRGAFLLPPRGLCDELVDAYFKWIAPIVPVINRTRFMRRYRDPKNPPSLLLLQAILLAGSRVCNNPQLMDSNGSTTPAAMTFYKRAKALFDANYEDDRVTLVQALILMGWYWEGPEEITKNVFYWTRIGVAVAQGSGMHRSVESSQLPIADKRLWKRIWWTLFTRDRSVAVALGRPCCINLDDSDVEMVSEDDFIDDDNDRPADYPVDPVHVQFFLNYVKLTEIMGMVLSQQYSVANKMRKNNALDLTHSDMALADWLQNCPKEVYWERPRHHFWSALLHSHYYTTLCLLHRAHMPPAGTPTATIQNGCVVETAYPSRNIAYQAAGMITSIIESLRNHDELRYTPAFIVYSLFSALIMHVYQMRSSNSAIVSATEKRMQTCMSALKDVAKVWLVAKMVHTLFESILGNKVLEERLQKAAGKRHHRNHHSKNQSSAASVNEHGHKRKFEDIDHMQFGNNGQPAPQMSYERSRPQTPAPTPSRELPQQQQQQQQGQVNNGGQNVTPNNGNRADGMMNQSYNGTRATTPFQNQSYPGTPPDLFLVTRNSPGIPPDMWSNFQPDQLFPADTNISIPNMSPNEHGAFLDPQLTHQGNQMAPTPPSLNPQGSFHQQQQMHPNMTPQSMPQGLSPHDQHLQPPQHQQMAHNMGRHQNDPSSWAQFDTLNERPTTNDDNWSTSSVSQGPGVPTTLNVEDWLQFFGISGGDLNGMSGFGGFGTEERT